jgi:hypothetical protein
MAMARPVHFSSGFDVMRALGLLVARVLSAPQPHTQLPRHCCLLDSQYQRAVVQPTLRLDLAGADIPIDRTRGGKPSSLKPFQIVTDAQLIVVAYSMTTRIDPDVWSGDHPEPGQPNMRP